ncbi:MAG: hypothetical protein RLZZ78_1764, partial [Armatimonadota bacterium]
MCALGLDIDHVDRLACRDVQLVPLDTAETEVRTNFRELNQSDSLALWTEHVDAIVAITNPATGSPDIAFDVTAKPIGDAACLSAILHRHLHARKDASVGSFAAIYDIIDADFFGAI